MVEGENKLLFSNLIKNGLINKSNYEINVKTLNTNSGEIQIQ